MEFWTTLIRVNDVPTSQAYDFLKENCTFVTRDYWIMEGEVDCLRDEGVELDEIAEGAVGSLAELTEQQLIQVCLDSYGVRL